MRKKRSGRVTDQWLASAELHLRAAVEFFGEPVDLAGIGVHDIERYAHWLAERPRRLPRACRDCGSGDIKVEGLLTSCASHECGAWWKLVPLSPGTRRKYLNSLSNLFRRAAGEGYVPPGHNPVAALMDKPQAAWKEARWLETHEAALLLEAACTFRPRREEVAIPPAMLHALIATFLLTGGRKAEVLGLAVDDVSFDRRRITFRPHPWRRLKTATSHRSVPLWPQLEEILRAYLYGGDAPRVSGLLFPSARESENGMIVDLRKALDAVAVRCGWKPGEVRTKMFRHTYCAARLQTLDRGHPISLYTVAKEMGHGGDGLVKRVYGHLGAVRHRSEVVEYRIEQHEAALAERLAAVRAGA